MIPSYNVEKTAEGGTKFTYTDAGNNPPYGVLLHYALAETPADPIRLEILDASGNAIREYASKPASSADDAEDDGQPKQNKAAGQASREWADANATSIDQYNAWASQREPYSQRVRHWRESGQSDA